MSTKELAYEILDNLSEEQLTAFISLFRPLAEMPNEETLAAFAEAEAMKKHPDKYKGCTDIDEMFRELLKE